MSQSSKTIRAAVISIEGATNEEIRRFQDVVQEAASKAGIFLIITNTSFKTCDLEDLEKVLQEIRSARR